MSKTFTPETATEREIEIARDVAHRGHDGHGSSDRAGYAAIAQVHATLAVALELHALRTVIGEVATTLKQIAVVIDE